MSSESAHPPPAASRVFTRGEVYGALERRFGFQEFRLGQEEVLRSILRGQPTIAVLPTGAGKSLCFQLPATLLDGTTLVISPLIALMADQVYAMQERGVRAAALHSALDPGERGAILQELAAGGLELLYVAPERLSDPAFAQALAHTKVPFLAVDEAHCVYQWGHDFRPAYLEIRGFVERLRPAHYAAFTATATPAVRERVGEGLGMHEPTAIVRGFHRPNLHLAATKCGNEEERGNRLRALVQGGDGDGRALGTVLAYARTRAQTEETAERLRGAGLSALHYHGGCTPEERERAQRAFLASELDVLVATNAFGMGIDKPDIRLVVHLSLPMSFEDWYQELGRAGRDGEPARNEVLWCGRDYRTIDFLIGKSAEEDAAANGAGPEGGDRAARAAEFQAAARRRLNRVHETFRSDVCLWRRLLEYFGDPAAAHLGEPCGGCAPCAAPRAAARELDDSQASPYLTILRAVATLGARLGRKKLAGILAGSKRKDLPSIPELHGALASASISWIEEALEHLLDAGLLCTVGDEYPTVGISSEGDAVARGEAPLALRIPAPDLAATGGSGAPLSAAATAKLTADFEAAELEADPALVERVARLKQWRRGQAKLQGVPAYVVFPDKTLRALAVARPTSSAVLAAVPGIGPSKIERYGEALLALLAEG